MNVVFYSDLCKIVDQSSKETLFSGKRKGNIYSLSFDDLTLSKCLVAKDVEVNLWHRRLGHASMNLLNKFKRKNSVRGFPLHDFKIENLCKACTLENLKNHHFMPKTM